MAVELIAGDAADEELTRLTRPGGWETPAFDGVYTLVAVGAGAAGLISAAGTGSLGGRAALVEAAYLGGDCLTSGCVPSKSLLAAAKVAHTVRTAGDFGVSAANVAVDFAQVMRRLRGVRAGLAPADAATRFRDEFGVDVYFGHARFTGPDTLEVAGRTLRFRRAVVATGSRPRVPDIEGLAEAKYLTNETVFALTELPPHLIVLGGGPIGVELGQAFRRLGSRVTVVTRGQRLLEKEEPEASELIQRTLTAEGVELLTGEEAVRVESGGNSMTVHLKSGRSVTGSHLLVALGRTPTVDALGLEAAGVAFDPAQGVLVNEALQTSNPRIYAAGDVATGSLQFTHAADATARLVLRNALFPFSSSRDRLVIPWCTFTEPEVARVGLSEAEARQTPGAVTALSLDFSKLDRAVTESEPGFLKLVLRDAKLVGATTAGPRAGEVIGLLTLAMTHNLTLKQLAATVFPYPTYGEAVRKLADEHNRTRLTPLVKRVLRFWLGRLR